MNKKHVIAIIGIIVMVSFFIIGASAIMSTSSQPLKEDTKALPKGDTVIVKMTMVGSTYKFEPASVNLGDKITIVADMNKISGCFRTVVIPSMAIRKYLSDSDNKIIFTAKKAGEFPVTCAMGMGSGKLIVKG